MTLNKKIKIPVHKNGRPAKTLQLEIQNELRKYFGRGFTASFTAKKTGINIKTVCKYFGEWSTQISEQNKSDFLEKVKHERGQSIESYDHGIFEVYRSLDYIENDINKCKNENAVVPKYLYIMMLDALKQISNIREMKISFLLKPIDNNFAPEPVKQVVEDITEDITADEIKKLTKSMVSENHIRDLNDASENDIIREIISKTKCSPQKAWDILVKMKELGLDVCGRNDFTSMDTIVKYNFRNFAQMRGYLPKRKIVKH